MKATRILLFLTLILLSVRLFAEEKTLTITVSCNSGKPTGQHSINWKEPSVPEYSERWNLTVVNKCNRVFHLKILINKNDNGKTLKIDQKGSTFVISGNKFPITGEDSVFLGNHPCFILTTTEGIVIDSLSVSLKNLKEESQTGTKDQQKEKIIYQPGFIYSDAEVLAKPGFQDLALKQQLLTDYGYDSTLDLTKIDPYLRGLGDKIMNKTMPHGKTGELVSQGVAPILNTIGNYDVTNIADGIARFLVKRVKEELSITFFQHFREVLEKAPASDLQYLFPTTYDILQSIDHEIYNWDNYITSLRDAFDKDLSNTVYNLETFEARASLLEKFRENTAGHVSARVALYVAKGFTEHVSAGQLLDDFNADEYIVPTNRDATNKKVVWVTKNINQSVKTMQLISSSLRSADTTGYWINDSQFRELLTNDELFGYYNLLLLLKAKKENICFQINKDDDASKIYLWQMINHAQVLKPVINGFVVRVKDCRSSYAKMEKAVKAAGSDSAKAKLSYIDLYPFIQSSVNILKYSNEAMYKLMPEPGRTNIRPVYETANKVLDIMNKGGELGMDLSLKRYSAVIADLTYLFNRTRDLIIKETVMQSKANSATDQVKKDSLAKIGEFNMITESLVKYGTFMASVANAKSSAEVEQVIQNHALPTGSSRIKRGSVFNVSINAYPGFYFGYEHISGVDTSWLQSQPFINSYGITAPLGIAISRGQLGKNNWSLSAFISVIDVGAIASFRVKNDSVASVPTILLKDIISPGVFLSVGLPKCPLSVNVGAQIGPNLRSVSEPSKDGSEVVNTYTDKMYWRFSASLVVDIPIFTLSNRLDKRIKKK